VQLNIRFTKGYIAHPYWPARERVITITKESGTNRARTEANRIRTLDDYLGNHGMTRAEYDKLVADADRQFYTVADIATMTYGGFPFGGHHQDEIVLPPHQIMGCLTQAADLARAANRIVKRDQVRSALAAQPIYTGKNKADGVWERFAVVTAGTGAKLTNQRALRRNEYISDFVGMLELDFEQDQFEAGRVRDFVAFAGREVGLGSSRRLGWGRFTVVE
jgi:hypothetical protein